MISIVSAMRRQNLIAQKNALQYEMLQNSAAQRNSLNSFAGGAYGLSFGNGMNGMDVFGFENSLALKNINDSTQLMAINAELAALNSHRVNYLA